jgi:drug/metabolite transporter (DMT)-like permease
MIRIGMVLGVALNIDDLGVVLISKGQKELQASLQPGFQALLRLALEAVTNRNLLLGVAFEAGFFGCLLFLLSRADVSFVWPLTSLSLVVTTLTARWLLHEQITPLRWMGVVLIVVGAGVVIYTEQVKRNESAAKGAVGSALDEKRRG